MNKLKYLIPILFLISCGKVTTFVLNEVSINLIHEVDIENVLCCLNEVSDSLLKNKRTGIELRFDVDYSESSGGMEPGLGGTKDSIVNFIVFHKTQTEQINITNTLYNLEENQTFNSNFLMDDYRCICFDSLENRYYDYVHDKRYEKPTIYTYDEKRNERIVYWANGDTSIDVNSSPIDMANYEKFFKNTGDFVTAYNKLHILRIANLSYKKNKILDSGNKIDRGDFFFWIPNNIVDQMSQGDQICIELELSDGRKLTDELMLK